MSSPKTEELYIYQTCYMKLSLTSNIKTEKIKQRIWKQRKPLKNKVFCKKLDNLKNKSTGVLQKFYAQMPSLPASDDITRFDGNNQMTKKHSQFLMTHEKDKRF
jgi:hypothetical protein